MHRTSRQQNPVSSRSTRDMHSRPIKPPERPLVPYMRFSRKMWSKVKAENPEVQLLDIGKIIGQMWREAPDSEKAQFQQEYEMDKIEYERQLKSYQQAMTNQHVAASRSRVAGFTNNSAAAIQPVDDEDPFEMTRKRVAGIRYDRDNRLMSEVFSSAALPDTRTLVAQSRIDQLKRQAGSLSAHQNKLNDELAKLEEAFQSRKKSLEEHSQKFNEEMKKIKNDKPEFNEQKYREYVGLWTEYYLEEFKKQKTEGSEETEKMEVDEEKAKEEEEKKTEEPKEEECEQNSEDSQEKSGDENSQNSESQP
ncbi:unnamed protein product [Bursaphelenchus okinawaensis]|uniref:HMG box domain-containing protein n=1 Tax=Bursaphelenchus okinawaensis TaxID=465554 RepID=A0A811K9M9_9BILA|nr:unnamed protein product [Bursaphelenchus okinawaensis]CAG9095250.1 unnamed protein product [Bursaphelenchus okinawaensis]